MTGFRRALAALLGYALLAGCGSTPPPPRSQFGEYNGVYKRLTLANGDTFTVYRVKYWRFEDGGSPAVQLEFEPGFEVADTVRLATLARQVWPAFAPYLEAQKVTSGILTVTNLKRRGTARAYTATMQHYGLIAERDSAGTWWLLGDSMPPAEAGPPRITEHNGTPLPFDFRAGP